MAVVATALLACGSGGSGSDGAASSAAPPRDDGTAEKPSALFVLGDSLSDVGNAAAVTDHLLSLPVYPSTVGLCNPADVLVTPRPCDDLFYRQSRVSDGPVAVERLAEALELPALAPSLHLIPSRPVVGTVYAVAGAKARGQGASDLAQQVDMLLLLHHGGQLSADALYVLMIGGNDAIDALQAALSGGPHAQPTSEAIVAAAVAAIGEETERLLDSGARRLIVSNVPDLSVLPRIIAETRTNGDGAGLLATASAISESFNGQLSARLDRIENSGRWSAAATPVLSRFDLHSGMSAALATIAGAGGNVLDACFDSETYRDSDTAERFFHPACGPAAGGPPKFSEFAFWDGIHPTGTTHAILGASMAELLIQF